MKSISKTAIAFILTFLLYCGRSFAQGSVAQTVNISFQCSTCTTPRTMQGLVYLPADYNTSTTHYPVLFYQNGSMLPADLSGMAAQPLPYMIAHGMSLDNITNPVDGKKYSFIVVAIVDNAAPALPTELKWLNAHYRIDNSRVYVSGLSQGGLGALLDVTYADSVSRYITASVPMSAPNVTASTFNFNLLNTYKIRTWFFAGNADPFTQTGTMLFHTDALAAYPGSSQMTIYNGGHGGWNAFYDVNYRDPALNMSIYQWMLQTSNATRFPVLPVKIKSIKLNRKP